MPSFPSPAPITVRLDLSAAAVWITASDRDTTVVDVRPTDPEDDGDVEAAGTTRVEHSDGVLDIRSSRLRSWLDRRGSSVDVHLEVPLGSELDATLGMGDIAADGRLGACRLKTGLGSIRLDEAATLHLKNGAGDIDVGRVAGHAEVVAGTGEVKLAELGSTGVIKNSNGPTWVGRAEGEVRLRAANGDLAVEWAGANVVARTANGDVRIEHFATGTAVLETQVGDVDVGVPPGTAAWLDVNSRAGAVRNDLDETDTPDQTTATAEIRARTTLGDVVIRRPRGAVDAR